MATHETKKLTDLRVVDLKAQLETRDLDKTGVKAVLLERLQKVCIFQSNAKKIKEKAHRPFIGWPFCFSSSLLHKLSLSLVDSYQK